ncbi:MAG: PhnD/SsuA/transferrin family substrate-binding protein [Pseudomonadota bacterium]
MLIYRFCLSSIVAAALLLAAPLMQIAHAQATEEDVETQTDTSGGSFVEVAPPPSAAWRDDIGTLRIGVAASDDGRGAARKLELFRESVADKLDIPVEVVPFGDFLTLSDAQASGRIEYAIHSALSFAMTSVACNCVEPLAVPTFSGGAKGMRLIVIARSDANASVMARDGVAAKLALVGDKPDGSSIVEMTQALLQQEGPLPAAFETQNIIAMQDFSAAVATLNAGEVQGVLGWSTLTGALSEGYSHGTLRRLVETGAISIDDLELVWQSPEIALGPHAVRRNLPVELKGLLQAHLLGLEGAEPAAYDSVSPTLAGGFRAVRTSDYQVVKTLIEAEPDRQPDSVLRGAGEQ